MVRGVRGYWKIFPSRNRGVASKGVDIVQHKPKCPNLWHNLLNTGDYRRFNPTNNCLLFPKCIFSEGLNPPKGGKSGGVTNIDGFLGVVYVGLVAYIAPQHNPIADNRLSRGVHILIQFKYTLPSITDRVIQNIDNIILGGLPIYNYTVIDNWCGCSLWGVRGGFGWGWLRVLGVAVGGVIPFGRGVVSCGGGVPCSFFGGVSVPLRRGWVRWCSPCGFGGGCFLSPCAPLWGVFAGFCGGGGCLYPSGVFVSDSGDFRPLWRYPLRGWCFMWVASGVAWGFSSSIGAGGCWWVCPWVVRRMQSPD